MPLPRRNFYFCGVVLEDGALHDAVGVLEGGPFSFMARGDCGLLTAILKKGKPNIGGGFRTFSISILSDWLKKNIRIDSDLRRLRQRLAMTFAAWLSTVLRLPLATVFGPATTFEGPLSSLSRSGAAFQTLRWPQEIGARSCARDRARPVVLERAT